MSTYRVYIRRPLTNPPVWNWAQTVVANSSADAIQSAYDSWVNSNPNPPAPPLDQCTTQANLVKTANARSFGEILSSSSITPGQQLFMNKIQSKVNSYLGTQLDGTFEAANYPAGFNYGITFGSNAYYNPATLNDIDSMLAVASNGELELNGQSFSSYYTALLQDVVFTFSQADQQTINSQDSAASAQIASILQEFTNAGGIFSNPLPFGGRIQDVFNQLTKEYGSLSNLPDTLNALRNAIASYKSMAALSYALHNKYYSAQERLNAAISNATNPSGTNGGMQTGNTTFSVGYTPDKLPSANKLIGGLQTASNRVQIDMNLSNFTSNQSQLSIEGSVGISIPILDILDFSLNASTSYNLSKYSSSSTDVTISILYPGVTFFPAQPSDLSTDNTTGWYANDILQEVVAKTGQDSTGYKLTGSEYNVSDVFGLNKIFSRLKTFVISQEPTLTLTYTGSEVSQMVSDFQVNANMDVNLFGLFSLGSASAGYHVTNVDDKSVVGSVIVTFGPPDVSGTIPLQQQVAYVLGGVASYPPNNI